MDWFRGKSTGKPHRKMGNSMVSCKFSLRPIQWVYSLRTSFSSMWTMPSICSAWQFSKSRWRMRQPYLGGPLGMVVASPSKGAGCNKNRVGCQWKLDQLWYNEGFHMISRDNHGDFTKIRPGEISKTLDLSHKDAFAMHVFLGIQHHRRCLKSRRACLPFHDWVTH